MAEIEIETSTDSVEEVREALGAEVEIEESESEAEEKPAKPVKPSKEEKADPEESEEENEEADDEEEAEPEKPKKQTPHMVSRARLNKEIARRESLERQLAERQERQKPAVEKFREENNIPEPPQTWSGQPEPKIEDFVNNDKYPDPYAAHTKVHGAWVRAEVLAEVAAGRAQEAANAERNRVLGTFQKNVEKAIKERIPDYKEVVPQSTVRISGLMEKRIYKSEFGPDMLRAFAEDEDRAAEIVAMDYDDQVAAMVEFEREIKTAALKAAKKALDASDDEEEADEEEPPVKKKIPGKKVSIAPLPPNRIKGGGPQPKTLEEMAGPPDRTGVDIEFNPALERAEKAKRKI